MILDRLIAGDTLDFVDQVGSYPATDGWTLKYSLVAQFATPVQVSVTLTATTYNTIDYRVQVGPAVTAAWVAGVYSWARWVEKTGARQSLGEGRFLVEADPSTRVQGFDARTQAEKALEDAETALATFNSTQGHIKSYSIAGRSMEFSESGEILGVISYWKIQIKRERAAKAIAEGKPDPRRIYLRANNA